MRAKRQNNQSVLAFSKRSEGGARSGACEGTEACVARADTERPATGPTMEEVLEPGNLRKALERVRRNRGAPGPDGMTVEELGDYLKEQWPGISLRQRSMVEESSAWTVSGIFSPLSSSQ